MIGRASIVMTVLFVAGCTDLVETQPDVTVPIDPSEWEFMPVRQGDVLTMPGDVCPANATYLRISLSNPDGKQTYSEIDVEADEAQSLVVPIDMPLGRYRLSVLCTDESAVRPKVAEYDWQVDIIEAGPGATGPTLGPPETGG